MKKSYISPEMELVTFSLKDVILTSIINKEPETYASSGVVIIDDELEEEEP